MVEVVEEAPVPPEQQLQVISDLVRNLVAGNPIVTTEELPKWFAGFLLAMKTVDAERLSEIRQLTRELDEARRKIEILEAQLGSEKTIVEVTSEPE